MKRRRIFSSVLASTAIALAGPRASAALIGYWDFNDSNLIVDQGSGTLAIDPTLVTTGGAGLSYPTNGTTVNAVGATPAGNALQIKSNANNGKYLQFAIDASGKQNIVMSLAAMRNSPGFDAGTVSYSTDGGASFTTLSIVGANPFNPTATTSVYSAHSFDFSGVAGLNNLSDARFRIAVNGADNNGGMIEFDNIQFNGDDIVVQPPPPPPPTIGLTLAPVDPVIITGGSTSIDAAVSNTAAAGAADLNYTISGGGFALGLLPAAGIAAPAAAPNPHSVIFTGAGVGLQLGSATVSDPDATNDSQVANTSVTVLDHATPSLTTLLISFGTLAVSGTDAMQSVGIDNLPGSFGAGLTAGLDLIAIDEIGDDGSPLSGTFLTNMAGFTNKPASSPTSFFDVFFDLDAVGSFSATYRLHFADQDLPGAVSRGYLDLLVQGNVVNPRQDPPGTDASIPEPASAVLAGMAVLAFGARRRRTSRWKLA